jgi:4-hydroxy-3-polyprenylbenzoate decarboxylase
VLFRSLEDYYLGKATERLFLPLLKTIVHDIEDYDLPMFGAFHNAAFVKIKKAYPLQGRRVMHSIWGAGQMAWTKSIFVVDHDIDVHDVPAVLRAVALNSHPGRAVEIVNGPLDILDHAAPRLGAGAKIGFDATRPRDGEDLWGISTEPLPPESFTEEQAKALEREIETLSGVTAASVPQSCGLGWCFVAVRKENAGDGVAVVSRVLDLLAPASLLPRFVVVVGAEVDVTNVNEAMFHWCANCDVSRDMVEQKDARGVRIRLGFDATAKVPGESRHGQPVRAWPPILKHDPAVEDRVASIVASVRQG